MHRLYRKVPCFAYAILSETLANKILGHLPSYPKSWSGYPDKQFYSATILYGTLRVKLLTSTFHCFVILLRTVVVVETFTHNGTLGHSVTVVWTSSALMVARFPLIRTNFAPWIRKFGENKVFCSDNNNYGLLVTKTPTLDNTRIHSSR